MAKNLKIVFTIFCLLATSVVTVATSKKQDGDYEKNYSVTPESLARKDYYVASNCPQAISQDRITVADELIEYPENRNFNNYGLPTYNMNLTFDTQVAADMNGRQRSCIRSEQVVENTPLIVFTCSENGRFLCHVSFELVQ